MPVQQKRTPQGGMILKAMTAAELMSPNPVSLRDTATVPEAMVLLVDQGFGGAPVIDDAGRPVGVVTQTDLLIHDREQVRQQSAISGSSIRAKDSLVQSSEKAGTIPGFQTDRTRISDIMTPVVFAVAPDATVRKVVQELLSLKVHRLFVVDTEGILLGVISAQEILRHLE